MYRQRMNIVASVLNRSWSRQSSAEKQLPSSTHRTWLHSAVNSTSDCRSRACKFEFQLRHITFMEIDNEFLSMVILLLLIQEWQFSFLAKIYAIVLVNSLEE